MATQTPNLNLDLREASDIFNPLSTNSNFETLDTVISDIQKKGGIVTYTTTASANLLKLSGNPTPNDTVFKFVAAGDANTWSYQEAVNNIATLDGKQKTVKAGELYVAWVNAANTMVVIAWPDVVNAQTFDGKGPAEWATKAELDAVNQTAANATQTAQAAATVANQALEKAEAAKQTVTVLWTNPNPDTAFNSQVIALNWEEYSTIRITATTKEQPSSASAPFTPYVFDLPVKNLDHWTDKTVDMSQIYFTGESYAAFQSRSVGLRPTGISIGNARYQNLNGSSYSSFSDQTRLIPYQILGIK